jgi:hypothetical protein
MTTMKRSEFVRLAALAPFGLALTGFGSYEPFGYLHVDMLPLSDGADVARVWLDGERALCVASNDAEGWAECLIPEERWTSEMHNDSWRAGWEWPTERRYGTVRTLWSDGIMGARDTGDQG